LKNGAIKPKPPEGGGEGKDKPKKNKTRVPRGNFLFPVWFPTGECQEGWKGQTHPQMAMLPPTLPPKKKVQ